MAEPRVLNLAGRGFDSPRTGMQHIVTWDNYRELTPREPLRAGDLWWPTPSGLPPNPADAHRVGHDGSTRDQLRVTWGHPDLRVYRPVLDDCRPLLPHEAPMAGDYHADHLGGPVAWRILATGPDVTTHADWLAAGYQPLYRRREPVPPKAWIGVALWALLAVWSSGRA